MSPTPSSPCFLALVTAAACALASPRGAHAQSETDVAARRVLLEQAQQASTSGDHARALDLGTRAGRLQMTATLRQFLAEEQSALGRVAEAFGNAELCMRDAERERATLRDPAAVIDRCRTLRESLRARVGLITVRVPAPRPAGLQVTVAGSALNEALYDAPFVVSPGSVAVEATAPGHEPFRQEVAVAAQGNGEIEVRLTPAAAPPPDPNVRVTPPPGGGGGTRPGVDAPPSRPLPVGSFVVMGAGALILGSAGLFFGLRQGALGPCTADNAANVLVCPTDADAMNARAAYTFNTLTNVSLIAGGVVLAGGLTWFLVAMLTRPSAAAPPPRAALHVAPTLGGGLTLGLGGPL